LYFLSTGDEDHGRQRIGRCTGGSADPFLGTERGPSDNRTMGPARSEPRYAAGFSTVCPQSCQQSQRRSWTGYRPSWTPAPTAGGDQQRGLTAPEQRVGQLGAADQTPQARLVRWTGAERCQRPRNRRCLQRCSGDQSSGRASAEPGGLRREAAGRTRKLCTRATRTATSVKASVMKSCMARVPPRGH